MKILVDKWQKQKKTDGTREIANTGTNCCTKTVDGTVCSMKGGVEMAYKLTGGIQ